MLHELSEAQTTLSDICRYSSNAAVANTAGLKAELEVGEFQLRVSVADLVSVCD